jgi:hypothetical protein
VATEYAKYQYYWDQRTIWLAENKHLWDTPLYQERRQKRQAMTARWNEIRLEFVDHAGNVQAYAEILGKTNFDEIKERYGLDYSRLGKTIDVYLVQWKENLYWNPEPPPF